jgi:hypothetical protein
MDEIVRQAMSKWPNVPHCFGWLRLDARGHWRMRDERTQQLDLPGDKISHPALLTFINRNYQSDSLGQWYFQNGPQRVYVDLELTPYIMHTDPALGLLLHTGAAMPPPLQAWLTPQGQLILRATGIVAALDDRDSATLLAHLNIAGNAASDKQVLAWLEGDEAIALHFNYAAVALPLERIATEQLAQELGFTARPRSLVP